MHFSALYFHLLLFQLPDQVIDVGVIGVGILCVHYNPSIESHSGWDNGLIGVTHTHKADPPHTGDG